MVGASISSSSAGPDAFDAGLALMRAFFRWHAFELVAIDDVPRTANFVTFVLRRTGFISRLHMTPDRLQVGARLTDLLNEDLAERLRIAEHVFVSSVGVLSWPMSGSPAGTGTERRGGRA